MWPLQYVGIFTGDVLASSVLLLVWGGQVYSASVKISVSVKISITNTCLNQKVEDHNKNDKVIGVTNQGRAMIVTFQKVLI